MKNEGFLRCTVQKGMFNDEFGVEVKVGDFRVALFVSKKEVRTRANEHFLRVRKLGSNLIALPGEPIGDNGRKYFNVPKSALVGLPAESK